MKADRRSGYLPPLPPPPPPMPLSPNGASMMRPPGCATDFLALGFLFVSLWAVVVCHIGLVAVFLESATGVYYWPGLYSSRGE